MVYLILTRAGFEALRADLRPERDAVWIGAGVLSKDEVASLRALKWDLTTFGRVIHSDGLAEALDTIREHHPSQVVWAEALLE